MISRNNKAEGEKTWIGDLEDSVATLLNRNIFTNKKSQSHNRRKQYVTNKLPCEFCSYIRICVFSVTPRPLPPPPPPAYYPHPPSILSPNPQHIIPPSILSPPPRRSCSYCCQCIHLIHLLRVSRQCTRFKNVKYLPRSWLLVEAS